MLSLWGQAAAFEKIPWPPNCEVDYAIVLTEFADPTWPPIVNSGRVSFAGAILSHIQFLPLHPIWSGFAINTIFYATILFLPFAPFQVRKYLRVKRGLCIKCGYDLRGDFDSGCPECGLGREEEA